MRTPGRVKNEERIILLGMMQAMKNKGGVAWEGTLVRAQADLGRSLHRFGKGTFYQERRSVASWKRKSKCKQSGCARKDLCSQIVDS